jgi:hypothetical protein
MNDEAGCKMVLNNVELSGDKPVCLDLLLADCIMACNILQDTPELNPSNYNHDDVCRLNAAVCEAYQVLLAAIKRCNSATGKQEDAE